MLVTLCAKSDGLNNSLKKIGKLFHIFSSQLLESG